MKQFLSAAILILLCQWGLRSEAAATKADRPVAQTVKVKENGSEYTVKAAYRITSTSEKESLGEGIFMLKPEGRFVIVRFGVRNKGDRPAPSNILSRLSLVTDKGEEIHPSERAGGQLRLGSGEFGIMELAAGAEMNDAVVFDVPVSVKGYSVRLPGGAKIAPAKNSKQPAAAVERTEGKKAAAGRHEPPEPKKPPVVAAATDRPHKPSPAAKNEAVKPAAPGTPPESVKPRTQKLCALSTLEYENAVKEAEAKKDIALEGKSRYGAAECYSSLGRFEEAAGQYDLAAKIASRLADGELEVLSLLGKCRALALSGDRQGAASVFAAAAGKAETEVFGNLWIVDYFKALISYKMAETLALMGDAKGAAKRLDYARMLNYDLGLEEKIFVLLAKTDEKSAARLADMFGMLNEAHAAYEQQDYVSMEKAALKARATAKALRYRKGIFEAEYALANALSGKGNYPAALEHAAGLVELAETGNDYARRVLSYNLAGDLYRLKKEYEKAAAEYGKTLAAARTAGNKTDEANALRKIGLTVTEKDNAGRTPQKPTPGKMQAER